MRHNLWADFQLQLFQMEFQKIKVIKTLPFFLCFCKSLFLQKSKCGPNVRWRCWHKPVRTSFISLSGWPNLLTLWIAYDKLEKSWAHLLGLRTSNGWHGGGASALLLLKLQATEGIACRTEARSTVMQSMGFPLPAGENSITPPSHDQVEASSSPPLQSGRQKIGELEGTARATPEL